jgi:hypothetical protein
MEKKKASKFSLAESRIFRRPKKNRPRRPRLRAMRIAMASSVVPSVSKAPVSVWGKEVDFTSKFKLGKELGKGEKSRAGEWDEDGDEEEDDDERTRARSCSSLFQPWHLFCSHPSVLTPTSSLSPSPSQLSHQPF